MNIAIYENACWHAFCIRARASLEDMPPKGRPPGSNEISMTDADLEMILLEVEMPAWFVGKVQQDAVSSFLKVAQVGKDVKWRTISRKTMCDAGLN